MTLDHRPTVQATFSRSFSQDERNSKKVAERRAAIVGGSHDHCPSVKRLFLEVLFKMREISKKSLNCHAMVILQGPFNYYVTLFLANSDPPPCHKVSHRPDPPPPPPRNVTLVCRPENRKSVNKTYTIIVCFINRFSIFGPTDERYVTGGGVGRV